MAKFSDSSGARRGGGGRDPAKHSKKDPAKPTRAKAARPDLPPIEPALADLLNPAIGRGAAGPGSQTGLQPPPDNSFDRRADFAAAHTARKSTVSGFGEAPQTGYTAKSLGPIDPDLARALGITDDDDAAFTPPGRVRARIERRSAASRPDGARMKPTCTRSKLAQGRLVS